MVFLTNDKSSDRYINNHLTQESKERLLRAGHMKAGSLVTQDKQEPQEEPLNLMSARGVACSNEGPLVLESSKPRFVGCDDGPLDLAGHRARILGEPMLCPSSDGPLDLAGNRRKLRSGT
jgi:hypothetical protein